MGKFLHIFSGFFIPVILLLNTQALYAQTVAVDVGHTLTAPGAVSARGIDEFYFNYVLAHKVKKALESKKISVLPINFDGQIPSLEDRPRQASGTDFFLSIHHDSVQENLLKAWEWKGKILDYSDQYEGFSMFVSQYNPDLKTSLQCASSIGAMLRRVGFVPATHHADSMPGRFRPYADEINAVHYYDNLIVLYKTTLPAVLFEAGIIKNRAEELALLDPKKQSLMADAIATGIAACLYIKDIDDSFENKK